MSLGPKSGFGDLKWRKNSVFGPISWVLRWVFMGFQGVSRGFKGLKGFKCDCGCVWVWVCVCVC